jgi:hypothetical protein
MVVDHAIKIGSSQLDRLLAEQRCTAITAGAASAQFGNRYAVLAAQAGQAMWLYSDIMIFEKGGRRLTIPEWV